MSPQCRYFDICELPFYGNYNEDYCILHHPRSDTDPQTFTRVLREYLKSGKTDFRHVFFPERLADFTGHTFSSLADFRGAVFASGLAMQRAHLSHGLSLDTEAISGIDLSYAAIEGSVELIIKGNIQDIALRHAKLSGPFQLSAENVGNILGSEAEFSERLDIQAGGFAALQLESASLAKGLMVKTSSFAKLELTRAVLSGNSVIETKSANTIIASNAELQGDIKIKAKEITGTLILDGVSFNGNVTIDGRIESCSLAGATLHKELRIEGSEIRSQNFLSSTKFASTAELYFGDTLFRGDQAIIGRPPPKSINLNGARVTGKLTIHSELGRRRIDLVADQNRPTLGRDLSFANVDLSRFMLLGDFIDKIEISNVKWARRCWRNVLYDEVVMRKQKGDPPWANLKEAYQILKEKYSTMGDHAVSGDFHYGEMEAKRREYGWPKRILCPEFPYWACSGYGIGYIRAFLVLLLFLVGSAVLYYVLGGTELESDLHKSFLFSLQTAILLRPARPYDFSAAGEWIQVVQSVLVPIQAALFILALRMRLKR